MNENDNQKIIALARKKSKSAKIKGAVIGTPK